MKLGKPYQNGVGLYICSDEAQAKIFALKDKSEKEHQSYLQELKELDRQLEQDRKLREFMAIKSSERTENPFFRRHNLGKLSWQF